MRLDWARRVTGRLSAVEDELELSNKMIARGLRAVKNNLLVIRMGVAGLTQWGTTWRRERVCGRGGIRKNCGNLRKRQIRRVPACGRQATRHVGHATRAMNQRARHPRLISAPLSLRGPMHGRRDRSGRISLGSPAPSGYSPLNSSYACFAALSECAFPYPND